MWIFLAICSAFCAGLVSISVKLGMKDVDTNLGTFLRTFVVLIFTFIMVLIVGSLNTISNLTLFNWIFIIFSGLCTGLSWLCFFKALQIGNINKVIAVDKLSTVLTMLLAIIIFHDSFWWLTFVAMGLMLAGTFLMLVKGKIVKQNINQIIEPTKAYNKSWLFFAVLSLIFASLTSIFAKIGMDSINSNLGTFLRTIVVLIMAFIIVLSKKSLLKVKQITRKNWLFLVISGILTGISWLCYYRALQTGKVIVVVPIDKLSVLVTVLFSHLVYKEKLSKINLLGLLILVSGTLLLLI